MTEHRMLAEAYPDVAATWHPERNGTLTPDKVPPKTSLEVWWKCPAGHEWQERISTRTTLPKWKRGDIAACRHCSGFKVPHTYPCGHTVQITPEKAATIAARPYPRCWDCHQAWWEECGKAEMSKAAKAAAPKAADLIAAIPVQDDAPEPLVREWRWWAAKHLQGAYGREAVGWDLAAGESVEDTLASVTTQAAALVPSKADAGRAAAYGGVLRLLDQAHWAAAWLHYLTGRRPQPCAPDGLAATASNLSEWLSMAVVPDMEAVLERGDELDTAKVTKYVTYAVGDWVRAVARASAPIPIRCYRELRLPVVPPGAIRYGRIDTVMVGGGLMVDVAIEIDSAPNPSSVAKLSFARDMGAVPIWIRFGEGSADAPEGVAVIDLRTMGR